MNKADVAIIIPAYNEELTIADTIRGFFRQIPEARIVVVDNNSKDRTSEITRTVFQELQCRGTLLFEKRQGKGMAVRKAFSEIDASWYIMVDADTTYPADAANDLLGIAVQNEYDMVVGDRRSGGAYKQQNKRLFHNFGNNLITTVINMLFRNNLSDILSGYRVFSRKFVKNYPILATGFEIETEMTLHALDKRFSIAEVPIAYYERPEGSVSKLNTFGDGIRILKTIMWIFKDYKPLYFFGACALLSFVAGMGFGIPVIYEYIEFRYVYRIPSAVLSTGFMIVAMLFFAIGLILDTVEKFQRFNYELQLLHYAESIALGKEEK